MNPIHLLVPMSGQGRRYVAAGYTQPKPLIPVNGTPMITRLLQKMPSHWPCHFVLAQNHRQTELPSLLIHLRPNASLDFVEPHSLGPGHAIAAALPLLDDESPILISYCDYGMVWDPIEFEKFVLVSGCDACVISYRGFHAHFLNSTKYAYSRMEGECVVEVREKGSFTDRPQNEFASAGAYYFKDKRLLKKALDYQFEYQLQVNGEYYTSLTVEALLRADPSADVRVFEIPAFFQWGTPEDLRHFEYWERGYHHYIRQQKNRLATEQVLMPMAGLGSRFTQVSSIPKPLIRVNGTPMFKAALQSLPCAEKTVIVALEKMRSSIEREMDGKTSLITLAETPPGQAYSVQAGLAALDLQKNVLVSSCDHGIGIEPELWPPPQDADAVIFTIQGYPGAARCPSAYAYVIPGDESETPVVRTVSVKKPVSGEPVKDHLLVGTFWFRTGAILQQGLERLIQKDIRVNNELYLDSVFSCLQELGYKVRMIPLAGYFCWGDPESLAESSYWYDVFSGHGGNPRDWLQGPA